MSHGLAPSTHRTYKYAQHRFVNFCSQLGRLHCKGSPCPSVMLYCPGPTWLILVFFDCPNSPSLHRLILIIYFTWPAPTCLRFTIKTSRPDPFPKCCQIFIGQGNPPLCALSASEFTVPSSSYSNPVLHLTVADISAPPCLHHHQDFQVWLISTKADKSTLAEVSPTLCLTWNCMEVLLVHFFYAPMVCNFLWLSFLNGQKIVL